MENNIKITPEDVKYIKMACELASDNIDKGRVGIDAQILCYLVVGALNECAIHRPPRAQSAFRHSRNHSHRLLFGNAHVDVLRACLFSFVWREATS